MNSEPHVGVETSIKRVGRSGQISLGKQHAGQYFREHWEDDGSIVLVPVVVVAKSHWSIRDESKIKDALAWAAANPAKESDVDALVTKARRKTDSRTKRGR